MHKYQEAQGEYKALIKEVRFMYVVLSTTPDSIYQSLGIVNEGEKEVFFDNTKNTLTTLYQNLGELYSALGDTKESFSAYQNAIEVDPKNILAYNSRSTDYI